ncbi:TetR family transcriptional regulator [Salinifilum aidingensis]
MPNTSKGQRRRQQLVAAAAELLAEGGFEAVRHRAVAERSGLPLASTTYYFSSLDDLVAAAVEHEMRGELDAGRARLDELARGRLGTDEVVELVLDLLLGARSREGGAQPVLLRYERFVGTPRRPHLAPLMRRLNAETHELLGEVLARSGCAVPAAERSELIALVDGTVVNAFIDSDPDPRAAAARVLRARLG